MCTGVATFRTALLHRMLNAKRCVGVSIWTSPHLVQRCQKPWNLRADCAGKALPVLHASTLCWLPDVWEHNGVEKKHKSIACKEEKLLVNSHLSIGVFTFPLSWASKAKNKCKIKTSTLLSLPQKLKHLEHSWDVRIYQTILQFELQNKCHGATISTPASSASPG